MIKGVKREAIPYVLEADRSNETEDQTVFFVKPKRGHEANLTLKRYGSASRDGRGGYREFSVDKLDSADIEEFKSIVIRVMRYQFSEGHIYYEKFEDGIVVDTQEQEVISAIARDMSSVYMSELFDVAGDLHKLEEGKYLGKYK